MNLNFNNAKTIIIRTANRGVILTQKHSPELLLGAGIVGVVASTVLACKATLRVNEIKADTMINLAKINDAKNKHDKKIYSEDDYKRDLVLAYFQGGAQIVREYAPAVGLGVFSIGLLVKSHNILSKRNAAVVAAYKILDDGFKKYRERVLQNLGPEEDAYFLYGIPEKRIKTKVVDPETGKKIEREELISGPPSMLIDNQSVYARFFDSSSTQWRRDYNMNLFFLKAQQNYCNDILKTRGHVFLNEVYDMLGIPRSKEGAVVGWLYDSLGDNFIDFGIYSPVNELNRDYINGYKDQGLLLDFNVDGIIYDMI